MNIAEENILMNLPEGIKQMGETTSSNAHILVVDDEPMFRDLVIAYLQKNGFSAAGAASGSEMKQAIDLRMPALILLDINLPGDDGITIARQLRQQGKNFGIIMLTAHSDVVDRVVGLEVGADDYVVKPCDWRELLARVKSVLRRTDLHPGEPLDEKVAFGRCNLDLKQRKLTGPDGQEIKITSMEFDLLEVFARHRKQVLSRERLLELAHKRGNDPFDRSIDVRITRIRRKIEIDAGKPQVIKTVRGVGYVFE